MTIGIILIVIAVAEFLLGLYFLLAYQRSQATTWYGLFCIAVSIYVGANGIGYLIENFFIAERFGWAGGLLTAVFILPFSYSFPVPKKRVSELLPLILWPVLAFVPVTLWTNLFLVDIGVISYRAGYQTAAGQFFWALLTVFSVYWSWAMINLFRWYAQSDGLHRLQLRLIIFGILVSLGVSIVFDIIYPLVTVSRLGYIGSMFSAIWLGFTSYILVRK